MIWSNILALFRIMVYDAHLNGLEADVIMQCNRCLLKEALEYTKARL